MRILIAEDDPDMQKILTLYLKKEGYDVVAVSDGKAALGYLMEHRTDLAVLDWMMPRMSGIDVCRELRKYGIPVKVLMLTAKSGSEDEIAGLSGGADEYIHKPFDPRILMLRIKKLCGLESVLQCAQLSLNQENMTVSLGGEALKLTKKEYELLRYLMANRKIILSREKLLKQVWGMDYDGDDRTVDTHIRRLRSKIGEGFITTHVGLGYSLEEPHD